MATVGNRCTVRAACFAFELDHRGMLTSRSRHALIVFRYYDVAYSRCLVCTSPCGRVLEILAGMKPSYSVIIWLNHGLISIFVITRVSYTLSISLLAFRSATFVFHIHHSLASCAELTWLVRLII
jgi:hypothetical protein